MSLPCLLATSDGPPIPVPSAGGILPRPLLCGVAFADAVTADYNGSPAPTFLEISISWPILRVAALAALPTALTAL